MLTILMSQKGKKPFNIRSHLWSFEAITLDAEIIMMTKKNKKKNRK